ncbi:MAG: ABC transporter permease [Chloroflexi bacterium]|nr:ABC transporter permease [Chloroflexota bacterium]
MKKNFETNSRFFEEIKGPFLATIGGILVGGIIMVLAGYDPVIGYKALIDGAFGGKNYANLVGTLVRSAPIIGLAIAASIAFKAGFFNIGIEGQMVLGAVTSTLVAIYSPFPLMITAVLSVISAILVSGAYALFSAWMDVRYKIPIFISTLLLNYPANYFTNYLVNNPFRDRTTGMVQTEKIPEGLQIPKIIPSTQFHAGMLLIPVLVLIVFFVFRYTLNGYKIRTCGFNKEFLKYGGIGTKKLEYRVMFVSGALAGLIGLLEVFGTRYRYIPGMLTTPLYAWTAVTTAILANSNPIGVFFAGLLLAAIQNGGFGMERSSDVPRELSRVIQAIIIMIVCAATGLKSGRSKLWKED